MSLGSALRGCAQLRLLDVSYNRLEDIEGGLEGLTALRQLHVNGNALESLNGLENVSQSLTRLDAYVLALGSAASLRQDVVAALHRAQRDCICC